MVAFDYQIAVHGIAETAKNVMGRWYLDIRIDAKQGSKNKFKKYCVIA